jgi:hypothetical protein
MRAWDSSPYKNHGLVTGAKGRYQGRLLNGNDQNIVIPNSQSLNMGASDWSIEAWATTYVLDAATHYLALKNSDYAMRIGTGNTLQFSVPGVVAATADTTALSTGKIYQFIISYNQSADILSYFVNGVPTSSASFNSNGSGTSDAYIGTANDLSGDWNGFIFLERIYKVALKPQDAKNLYLHPYDMFLE